MVKKALNFIIISMFFIVFLYPFLYIVNIAISSSHAITNNEVYLIPKGINFIAFKVVLQSKSILSGYINSIAYTTIGTVLTLILCTSAAYVLSVREFKFKKSVMAFFTITMFLNGGIIPSFLLMKYLGLIDSMWAVIIPGALSAWNIIIFKTNFKSIPQDIIDSAKIDGANHYWIYGKIVIQLSKAIIATIGLFTIVAYWNSFFPALLYLTSQGKQPLMIVLRKLIVVENMRGEFMNLIGKAVTVDMDEIGFARSVKMAIIIVSIFPILLVYPFLQKYFTKGALVGSIKE